MSARSDLVFLGAVDSCNAHQDDGYGLECFGDIDRHDA